MQVGYIWITIGCLLVGISGISFCYGQYFWMKITGGLSAIFSAFLLWYGPHLLGQSKEEKKTKGSHQNTFSDSSVQAGRDVNFNQMVIKENSSDHSKKVLSLNEAKVKIRRIIEDYGNEVNNLVERSQAEEKEINIRQNRRNSLQTGRTIDLHLKRIKELQKSGEYKEMNFKREIENIALELDRSEIDDLWEFSELSKLKNDYERAKSVIKNAVPGMLSEVNQLANRLGIWKDFEQMKKENGF